MASKVSKQTRKALKAFGRSIKTLVEILESPNPDANSQYLADEFLSDMEDMFKMQLVSVVEDQEDIDGILISVGLDYMCEDVAMLAQELNMER